MNCSRTKRFLPGYLDGALSAPEHHKVREHLAECCDCKEQLKSFARLSAAMARVERPVAPAGLAARIRSEVARVRAVEPWHLRAWSRVSITFQNFLAPVALPTTGGLASAVIVFAFVAHTLFLGNPVGAVIKNDVPTNLIRPAEVVYLAPFPISASDDQGRAFDDDIMVETVVDSLGQAVSYEILSGPDNKATRRQLDQVVFFSRFRPQISFGRAESGGRVLLSFREVRVKG